MAQQLFGALGRRRYVRGWARGSIKDVCLLETKGGAVFDLVGASLCFYEDFEGFLG